VLIDPLLKRFLEEERKIDPHIFKSDPNTSFRGLCFWDPLGDALRIWEAKPYNHLTIFFYKIGPLLKLFYILKSYILIYYLVYDIML
jgi:hypothetical protein